MHTTPGWAQRQTGGATGTDLAALLPALDAGGVLVLSGAGISTDSGIPDYRGPNGRLRRDTPMHYDQFVGSAKQRRRYWARSHLGWRGVATATPNDGHRAVAALQAAQVVTHVITQNVDGLHQAAGTKRVVELHGSLGRVVCLHCGACSGRAALEDRLTAANPSFAGSATLVNPDGDVELDESRAQTFRMVACSRCGTGTLKPDVVFFGENVPRERVRHCFDLVHESKALLVLGSSLAVLSGLRFVRAAAREGKPVYILNRGPTRGDEHAAVRVDRELGSALNELARRVLG